MSTDYNHGFRSVYRLTAQVVFVIKYRRKAINNEILARLKEILASTLTKWDSVLLDFNGESDHVHLIIDYKPDIALSKLIANLKTVSSRLIRKEFPDLAAKYFYNKPYFKKIRREPKKLPESGNATALVSFRWRFISR